MNTFTFQIVTPQEAFAERDLVSAEFQAESGRLTVLANHQAMVCSLKQGKTKLKTADGAEELWDTDQGVLEVNQNNVTVLVHGATITDTQ
jgi:F0F1-type ATP synthase epsilon subunit